MQRRKFIAGVGSLAAAGAAGIGTSAFSDVEATREIGMTVQNDANAYLGLVGDLSGSANDNFATTTNDGELKIEFSGETSTDNGGNGPGQNSTYYFDDVFGIVNQGTQPVSVYVPSINVGGELDFYVGEESGANGDDHTSLVSTSPVVELTPGEQVRVGVKLDTGDSTGDPWADGYDITIAAEETSENGW